MTTETMTAAAPAAATETRVEPLVQPLLVQLGFMHYAFHCNVKGITHEESLRSPAPAGNCLNWVVGHIVTARQGFLQRVLHVEPVFAAAQMAQLERYRRGSSPLAEGAPALRLEELVVAYDASQERLVAGLRALTPERLAEAAPFSPGNDPTETVGSLVAKLTVHEGYHIGQTAVLRRILGHSGGIA